MVTGTAVYYRVATPEVIAASISSDPERDYLSAFDELHGCYKDVFSPELLRQFREEE